MNNRPIASQQRYNKNIDVYNRYRNEVDNSRTQMNMEANPSIEIDLLKGYHSDVPSDTNSKEYKQWLKQRKDFAVDITKALRDENGEDIINKEIGLKTVKFGDKDYNHGVGIYYGSDGKRQASIGQQDFIKPEYDEKGNLTAEFCDKMDLSCLLHAIVLRQDAVTWGKYEESASESDGNAIVFDVGENVPMDKANNLIKELENECKKRGLKDLGSFCFIPNNEGFAINNFTWGEVSNAEFQKVIIEIVDSWAKKNYNKNIAGRIVSYGSGVSKNGGYVSIELEDAKNGFGNVKRDFGKNEKDVLWKVRNELLSNGLQEVYEKFSKIWGNAGTVPTGDPEIDAFISSLSREDREAWTRKESELLIKKDKTLKNKTGAVYFGNIAKKAGIKVSDTTGVRYNKTVYHGSNASFDKFDSSHLFSGNGGHARGVGLYFTENIREAKSYARKTQEKNGGTRNLYKVDIPDNKYFSWNFVVDEVFENEEFYNALVSEFGESEATLEFAYLETLSLPTGEVIYHELAKMFAEKYNLMEVEGEIEASNFLSDLGYAGIVDYKSSSNLNHNVVFDDSNIKILEHYEYMTDEEGSMYRKNVDTAYTYSQGIKPTKPTNLTNSTKPTNLIKPTMPTKPTNFTNPTKPTMPTNLTKATNPTRWLLMGPLSLLDAY